MYAYMSVKNHDSREDIISPTSSVFLLCFFFGVFLESYNAFCSQAHNKKERLVKEHNFYFYFLCKSPTKKSYRFRNCKRYVFFLLLLLCMTFCIFLSLFKKESYASSEVLLLVAA